MTKTSDYQAMAKQPTVTITDDLDGSATAKEASFNLDGRTWTIDLSAKNRAALEKALKPDIASDRGRVGSVRMFKRLTTPRTRRWAEHSHLPYPLGQAAAGPRLDAA